MLRRHIYILFFLLIPLLAFSQKESFNWYFGVGAGITFNPNGIPGVLLNNAMISGKGCAVISDSCTGQLYFYTNGDSIIDRSHKVMLNGNNLDGSSGSTQSAIIVPSPDGSSGEFFVFTVERNNGLKYSIVDINLGGGLGGVIASKKNISLVSPTVEKVTAVRHVNSHDVWIVTHTVNSNEFYAFLLTDNGISGSPVISKVGQVYGTGSQLGYMKASPKGDLLGLALQGDKRFDVFDFDNTTGIVSNPRSTGDLYNYAYGLEFSPDGSKMYVTSNLGLFQYDLSSALLGKPLGDSIFLGADPQVAIQLGPDGRVYCNEGFFLGVIADPNEAGTNCNYVTKSFSLGGKFASAGLPTFMQSYFSPMYIIEDGICHGLPTGLELSTDRDIDSIRWDFDDPGTGAFNSSTLVNPNHLFSKVGSYNVTTYVYTKKCGLTNIDTIQKTIEIKDIPIPNIDLGYDTVICATDSVLLWTDGSEPSYLWSNGSKSSQITVNEEGVFWVTATNACGDLTDSIRISHFKSEIEADLGPDTLLCSGKTMILNVKFVDSAFYNWSTGSENFQVVISEPGEYWVKVSDRCNLVGDTMIISPKESPKVNLGNDTVICEGRPLILTAEYPNSDYLWPDFSTGSNYTVSEEGSYRVRVSNDCGSVSDDIYIRTKNCECRVFVPNSFTPNSDGLNDEMSIAYKCDFKEFRLEIYNRWDEIIFVSTDPNTGWDATKNGKEVGSGVYFYLIQYVSTDPSDNEEKEIRGMITVVK